MAAGRAKTPQEYHSDTTRLTARLFGAPRPRATIIPAVLLSLIGGVLVAMPVVDLSIVKYAIALFGVPTLLAAVLQKPIVDALGGRTYLRRTALLSLSCLAVSVISVALARVLEALYSIASEGVWDFRYISLFRLAAISWGAPLWLSILVFLSTSDSRISRSIVPASLQIIVAVVIAAGYLPFSLADLVFAILVFIFFAGSALLLAEIANRPMRKSFGYDGLWLMGQFLDHITERGSAARERVEGFFQAISMPSQVHVGAIAFGPPPRRKAIIVVPSAHPGPMGSLGGSDLPRKLSEQLGDLSPAIIVPKGPSTHDQNIATLAECRRVGDKVRELVQGAKPSGGGTRSATATRGKATATAQFFGDSVLVVCSLAPNPTDDIDSATGHAARQEAKAAGARDALFIDAHNCMEVGSGLTHFGSRASYDIIEATKAAVAAAGTQRVQELKVGSASRPYQGNADDGLGPMGVQVFVVEASGQKTAYILFDGNNMACGLREKVIAAVKGTVDSAEVLTADDHTVNMTLGGFNPVGMKMDHQTLVEMARELTVAAVKDLAPVVSSFATGQIDDLRIFGPEASARLTTGVNLTVAVLKPTLVLSMITAIVLSLLALTVIH